MRVVFMCIGISFCRKIIGLQGDVVFFLRVILAQDIMVQLVSDIDFFSIDNRNNAVRESESDWRRHDVISKIAAKLTSADDGTHYICQADHQALKAPMRASVRISVLCKYNLRRETS